MKSWAARALVALSATALTVPMLGQPASAAGGRITPDTLPSIQQVARVFPALAGGEREGDRDRVIVAPGRTCDADTRHRGTSGATVAFSGDDVSARQPIVVLQAVRFRTRAKAVASVRAFERYTRACRSYVDADGDTATVRRERIGRLGDQRVGFVISYDRASFRLQVARRGAVVVQSATFAPRPLAPKAKTTRLTRLALAAVA